MNTCKTCKHWTEPGDWGTKRQMCTPLDPDTYKPMDRGFEVRICEHPEQTFCEAPVTANGFGVADGSTYLAMLATGQDFGCVRHETRESGYAVRADK
jgi:hypothetical protein